MEGTDLIHNIIRNIVSEVQRECKNHRIHITADFISHYIKLLELDPNRGLTTENLTDRVKVQHFVKFLVGKFGNVKDPQIVTVKLQHQFITQFGALERAVVKFRKNLNKRLYPLLLEIIEQNNYSTGEDLYTKITYYITLASGLGNPAHKLVFKEAIQVTKSVLTPDEIEIFPTLQNYIKQELMKCLIDIITGIRLYNRSCKKGGEEMGDLPELLEKGIKEVQAKLENCIETSLRRAKHLTLFVERHMMIRRFKEDYTVDIDFKTNDDRVRWEQLRDTAITYRQLVKTTRLLLEYVTNLDKHRKILKEKFDNTIKTLNETIIPTLYQAITDVFPRFTDLAKIWMDFQNDAVRLREAATICQLQMRSLLTMEFDSSLDHEQSYLEKWVESHDEQLMESVSNPDITMHIEDTQKFTKKDLEFNGYCGWVLTHTEGALIAGIIELGVVEYQGKFYSFSSRMAANSFTKNPNEYIMKIIEIAREKVHLIKFLNLGDIMRQYVHIKVLVEKELKPKKALNNVAVQTDTHFQESDINYEYFWNIWDYKRAVLKYRDLTNKKTKTVETEKTHQKESHHSQTFVPKCSETQTMREKCGNTQKRLNYFYGLRGIRRNYPFVMNLSEAQSFSQGPKKF